MRGIKAEHRGRKARDIPSEVGIGKEEIEGIMTSGGGIFEADRQFHPEHIIAISKHVEGMTVIALLQIGIIPPVSIRIREMSGRRLERQRAIVMSTRRSMGMNTGTISRENAVIGVNEPMPDRRSNGSERKDGLKEGFRVGCGL